MMKKYSKWIAIFGGIAAGLALLGAAIVLIRKFCPFCRKEELCCSEQTIEYKLSEETGELEEFVEPSKPATYAKPEEADESDESEKPQESEE